MGHPDSPAEAAGHADAECRGALAGLARSWTRVVAAATFVPGPRARARTVLEGLLHRLVRGLLAEPFDPLVGYRVGADLVTARMSAPAVLGESITLLGHQLLPAIGVAGEQAAEQRLSALLGQLAAGFTEELRGAAVYAAEEINRAERAAWRRQQFSLQRRLQHALLHDPLTGLPNRAKLLESLAGQLAEAGEADRLGVCLMNLEQFTLVNDTFGHDAGDQLVRQISSHLRPVAIKHNYLLAHLGGDEFALVLPGTGGTDEVVKAVDQVLRGLPELFIVDGHRLPVTARAGIVECLMSGADPLDLLRSAHIALGWAKADQQGPYAVFDSRRCAADIRRHGLAVRMPAALRAGEFVLDYQPLVRLIDGGIVGAEALVRWHHPDLGVLAPDQFIPLAEQTGLIGSLGLHLLEQACVEAATWQRLGFAGCGGSPGGGSSGGGSSGGGSSGGGSPNGCIPGPAAARPNPPFVSVNLAPAQLTQPDLAASIAAVLDRTRLEPARLQLEITESAAVDAHHHDTLDRLAELGVGLAIDDFGTGYSSLAYLTELPVRTVKLAARFLVAGTPARPVTILPRVIAMCHDLGISVTAEGVETAAQARDLMRLRCDTGQGFYLARPTTPARLAALFRRGVHTAGF